MKEKYTLEYLINSSLKILFPRLSTAIGLSEWFADDVKVEDSIFIFRWKKQKQQARMIKVKEQQNIRFQWLDEELHNEEYYFEFTVSQDELTGVVTLTVTDFADSDEIEDSKNLWDTQINDLKRLLGS